MTTSESTRKREPTAAELAAFRAKWAARAEVLNWAPEWLYRSAKRAVPVRFAEIGDERRLVRLGRVCERQYLAEIAARRAAFVAEAQREGWGDAKAKWHFERELCKRDLYYLAKYRLGYTRMRFHLHYFMAQSVQELPPGYRGLREFPRDCYKTTVMTIAWMVQQVLRNPNVHILIKSNAEDNAAKKLCEAKNHFIHNAAVRALFPEHAVHKASDQGTNTAWTTPANQSVQEEATFTASGVLGSKTSQHYDKIVGDDFWDEKSVTSPEVQSKTRGQIDQLEYLLAEPARGTILFIGTRFAHDDPTSELKGHPEYHCIIVSGILPNGRSLFPEQLPVRKLYFQAYKLYTFSCQIMLNPTEEERGFQRTWFRYALPAEWRAAAERGETALRCVIVTDFTGGRSEQSDYAAAAAVLINHRGEKLVAEYRREKLPALDFLRLVYSLAEKWRPEFVVRQNAPLENAVSGFIDEYDARRREEGKLGVTWAAYRLGKRSKEERILGLQPEYQAGLILHHPDDPQIGELEAELLSFPNNTTNDDGADALSELTDATLAFAPRFTEPAPPPVREELSRETLARREEGWRQRQVVEAFAALERPAAGEEGEAWAA